jgi:glycosyltransferase 2 family protein
VSFHKASALQRPGKSFWIWLAKFALVAIIVFIIGRLGIINAATVARMFSRPVAAVAAVLAIGFAIHLSVVRWHLLLTIQRQSVPFWRLWQITFASYFIGTTTLGTLGADALRLYYIGRERPESAGQAYLSIAVDRLLGLLGLVVIGLALFAVNRDEIRKHWELSGFVIVSAAVGAGILAVGVLFVVFERLIVPVVRRFRPLRRTTLHINLLVQSYRHRLPTLGLCLLISVLAQGLTLACLIVLTRALFDSALTLPQLGMAGVMATIANQVPITPGGLALGEGTFAYLCWLMDPAGAANDYGTVVFLQRLVALLATLPGLFAFFGLSDRKPQGSAT